MCEEIGHKGHMTVPLKTYLLKAYGQVQNKDSFEESPLFYTKQIDEHRTSFFQLISNYREETLDMLNTLETQGKIFFNQIHQEMLALLQLKNPL